MSEREAEEIRLLREQNELLLKHLEAARARPVPTETTFVMVERGCSNSRLVEVTLDEYKRRAGNHSFDGGNLPPGRHIIMNQ